MIEEFLIGLASGILILGIMQGQYERYFEISLKKKKKQ